MQTAGSPAAPVAADRCPHRRPFGPGFAACPAHQPVTFVPTDTLHQPLPVEVTCSHLAASGDPRGTGRFYPRCALGSEADRVRWVADVTPARLLAMRALQADYDAAVAPQRDALFVARAAHLDSPDAPRRRDELDAAVRAYLGAAGRFMSAERARFAEIGQSTAALLAQVETLCRTWARARPAELGGEASQAFLHPVTLACLGERELTGRVRARR